MCHSKGEISVERVESREPIRFANVDKLAMPNDFEIEFVRMCFSCDSTNLFIYNSSGSILCYKWKLATEILEKNYNYQRCMIDHQLVGEDIIKKCLSLEQQKQVEFEIKRKIHIQQHKANILETISKLKNEFASIKDQNEKLPKNFQLSAEEFEIDKRINDDLEWRTQQNFKAIRQDLQTKIGRIRTQAEKIEHTYLDNLVHWPITITGFQNGKMVQSFLINEINDEFQALKVQFDEREMNFELSNPR